MKKRVVCSLSLLERAIDEFCGCSAMYNLAVLLQNERDGVWKDVASTAFSHACAIDEGCDCSGMYILAVLFKK